MVKKLVQAINKRTLKKFGEEQGLDMLTLQLAEIKEISDVLFRRLDTRIEAAKAAEASLESKIRLLQSLLDRTKDLEARHPQRDHLAEISELGGKGLKAEEIASILGMPVGEVELVLNLKGGLS